jgi:hypothetical protein
MTAATRTMIQSDASPSSNAHLTPVVDAQSDEHGHEQPSQEPSQHAAHVTGALVLRHGAFAQPAGVSNRHVMLVGHVGSPSFVGRVLPYPMSLDFTHVDAIPHRACPPPPASPSG